MNEVAIRQPQGLPTEHEMMVFHTMAEQAVSSKMYRDKGDKAAVMMIMLAARELGIPAMQALNGGINLIQGKVEISARMMNALIRKGGHKIEIKESTDERCVLHGVRADSGDAATVEYSVEDARRAGLVKESGGWKKCPKDMCFARALSRLARQLFSDVIGIGYVEGEISQQYQPPSAQIQSRMIPSEPPEESAEVWTTRYLAFFEPEDLELANKYLAVVCAHFGWTTVEAMKTLIDDAPKLKEKFANWKQKQQKQGDQHETISIQSASIDG